MSLGLSLGLSLDWWVMIVAIPLTILVTHTNRHKEIKVSIPYVTEYSAVLDVAVDVAVVAHSNTHGDYIM